MQLDEKALMEFIELYKKEYGISLSKEQAVEYAGRLIRFVKAVSETQFKMDIDYNQLNER